MESGANTPRSSRLAAPAPKKRRKSFLAQENSPRINLVHPKLCFDGDSINLMPGFITPSLTGNEERDED